MSIKSALFFVLIFVLILTVFTLSAFADSPTPSAESDDFVPVPTSEITLGSISNLTWYGYSIEGDIFACWIEGEYSYGKTYTGPCYLSKSPATGYQRRTGSNATSNAALTYNSTYEVYISMPLGFQISITELDTSLPVYSNTASAMQAFSDWEPSPSAVSSLLYSLPPGNIAYIPIPSGQSSQIPYTLTTTFPMAFGNNDLSRVNQVVTTSTTLPSGSSNMAPSSPPIPWVNNGSVNLFGTSAHKIYSGTVSNSLGGYYLVISNPMTMKSESGLIGGDTLVNPSILIEMDAVGGPPIVYPMSDRLVITDGNGIDSESSYGDEGYTYEVDPETGEIVWTDPDGGNSAPVAGGNNPMPTPNTIFDWLRNISQQLSDFLRGPVQAVQVVVSAIRDFMGSFTQLYQWLPSPVYSLITSALMIALTIGVIKIFV